MVYFMEFMVGVCTTIVDPKKGWYAGLGSLTYIYLLYHKNRVFMITHVNSKWWFSAGQN